MKRVKLDLPFFFDYKSPFSYLAKDAVFRLPRNYNVSVDFLPFDFSRLQPNVFQPDQRSEVEWRKIRYFYSDVRRFANRRSPPLVIKGPKKLFDSSPANIGGLFCKVKSATLFEKYTDFVFEQFFLRKLEIDKADDIGILIERLSEECGDKIDRNEYSKYLKSEGEAALRDIENLGDKMGVFGVPTIFVEEDMYFGNDRMEFVEEHLQKLGLKRDGIETSCQDSSQ